MLCTYIEKSVIFMQYLVNIIPQSESVRGEGKVTKPSLPSY